MDATLSSDTNPTIRSVPVQDVDTGLVSRVLEPIWTVKPETASRLCGRIEAILNWSTVRGYCSADNHSESKAS
jgi:hypothetical protein